MTKDEALKLALETLEQLQGGCTDHDDGTVEAITVWCPEVIEAIEAALAQPEQGPVLWGVITPTGKFSPYAHWSKKDAERIASASHAGSVAAPLYADAPQRPWVGLTDEELQLIYNMGRTYVGMMEMVEAKLKEKNLG